MYLSVVHSAAGGGKQAQADTLATAPDMSSLNLSAISFIRLAAWETVIMTSRIVSPRASASRIWNHHCIACCARQGRGGHGAAECFRAGRARRAPQRRIAPTGGAHQGYHLPPAVDIL